MAGDLAPIMGADSVMAEHACTVNPKCIETIIRIPLGRTFFARNYGRKIHTVGGAYSRHPKHFLLDICDSERD